MSCLFNSYDPYFKQPFGAVRAGQSVHLTLCIPEELGYVDPHLVIQKEGKYDVPVYYRMKFDGQTPKQNHFSVDVTLNDVGLYFYYFDLYTDFRRIVRGPDNCGVVSWQEGESWQITVYESDFETPAPIKGKVFYQIFPDRFCEGVENKPMPFADRIYQADKHAEPFWQPNEVGGHLNEDYFGGDLKGIQMKLPYLREMGVDYLYLNPIFEAHSNHRYNTADYLKADPLLGTNEEFSALCAAAAKEGIRGMSRVAATEWGKDGINVNVVCPLAWTAKLEQFRDAYPDAFKANVKMPPMGHYGNAELEIGRVCVQLAMPDFKFMSGETLTLEGGMGQRP